MRKDRNPAAAGRAARGGNGDDDAPRTLAKQAPFVNHPIDNHALDVAQAAEAIEIAKAAEPTLTGYGVAYRRRGRLVVDHDPPPLTPEGVAIAIEFLMMCRHARAPVLSSYGIKHSIERWCALNGRPTYIANGQVVVAAIFLGLKIAKFAGSPNVGIAVEREDVEWLDPDCPRSCRRRRRRWRPR